MPRVMIDLSEDQLAFLEREIAEGRAANRRDVLMKLIRDSRRLRALEEIGRLAKEGIESGPSILVDDAYWEKKRRKLKEIVKARSK